MIQIRVNFSLFSMLFWAKQRVSRALAVLVILTGIGLLGRDALPAPTPWGNGSHLLWGLLAGLGMLGFDLVAHTVSSRSLGPRYVRRMNQLQQLFAHQSWGAILAGTALAAVGEEWVFRGMDSRTWVLAVSTVGFGLAHAWPSQWWGFALWAMWEGLLLGVLVVVTGGLLSSMVAHGLHDLAAQTYFRHRNRKS